MGATDLAAGWRRAYLDRTKGSRAHREGAASHLADSRAVAGWKPALADLVYPIVGETARGAHLRDVDGNDYVDIAMGFGVQLFGHGAPFITEAVTRALGEGLHIGPQARRAGAVAERLTEMTGTERACFCNSGTEAVMTALRLARAATGRDGVAMFKWSYHGHPDATLGRPTGRSGAVRPLSPGVARGALDGLMMLDYGEESAFEALDAAADGLAAVLVEPVQSLRPRVQPRAFLARLAEWCRSRGVVLIFDEILLGFRIHPGGAQAHFGVRADLVTYGKILGGGLPIGAVAGQSALMDLIDGGARPGVEPRGGRVFFAGTFNKNPLGMAAAEAVLRALVAAGPALQSQLNARTEEMAARLEAQLAAEAIPLGIARFGSLFRFESRRPLESFYFRLLLAGVHVWEGRSCFLSTAHGAAEIAAIEAAVMAAARAWAAETAPEPAA